MGTILVAGFLGVVIIDLIIIAASLLLPIAMALAVPAFTVWFALKIIKNCMKSS